MPGSNPLFTNTPGGALAIQTKDGLTTHGTTVQAIYGSDAADRSSLMTRRRANGIHWYLANLFADGGEALPSDVASCSASSGGRALRALLKPAMRTTR
jgi:hypothetical protein